MYVSMCVCEREMGREVRLSKLHLVGHNGFAHALFSQIFPVCVLHGLYNVCACKHVCVCVIQTNGEGGEIKQGVFDVA